MSSAPSYEYGLPQQMITLSAIAYDDENRPMDDIATRVVAGLANPNLATRGLWSLVWGPLLVDETLMYCAADTSTPGRFALAIRGTDWLAPLNWLQDAWIGLTDYPLPTADGSTPKITKGTALGLKLLADMYDGVAPHLFARRAEAEAFASLHDLLASHAAADGVEVIVTGHSMGGCLASAFVIWLADRLASVPGEWTLSTYTFAAPTAGDAAFAAYADARLPGASFRYYNERDIVPLAWNEVEAMKTTPTKIGLGDEWVIPILDTLILDSRHKQFTQPITGFALSGPAGEGGWLTQVGREHASSTYLRLMNAPPLG